MADLQSYRAKKCLTAAGVLIHDGNVLLIKHKKMGFWLCPGGHIDEDELPHIAAEREFWEETGVRARALPYGLMDSHPEVEDVPSPISSSLHWVCRENYEHRVHGAPLTAAAKKHWAKGCEQHFNLLYLLEPSGDLNFKKNIEETDGIGWFTLNEVFELGTHPQIETELEYAFKVMKDYARTHA